MSPEEKKIADAAILATRATNFYKLHSDISDATGIERKTVEPVLARLVAAFILKISTTPAQDRNAGDIPQPHTFAWYEKGEMWMD